MKGSIERVRAVINGETPDRAPLYELIRNDAVIEHFTGTKLTVENGPDVVPKAFEPAVDATRPNIRTPSNEETFKLKDGRERRHYRWTDWTEHRRYEDSDAYEEAKRKELDAFDGSWSEQNQKGLDASLSTMAKQRASLGEVFFFPGVPGPSLMGIYDEIGLEQFSYYLADCGDLIVELLERNVVRAELWARHLPDGHGIEGAFLGDDIAYNTGPLLNPRWMREHYFPRLTRVITELHAKGIKVLFHSDGNLNTILDDLVEAGIDGLNPIEVNAGMDVGDIHRRHPQLFLAGGVDVSRLLPFGTPEEVKETVGKAIDEAEGRILVGSSTELNDEVPLENYLALREAVLGKPYSS